MTAALAEVTLALREALGEDRVRDGDSERDLHGVDLSFHTPQRPDLVVYPMSTADVAQVLVVAGSRGIPVTPFGAGTSLEGHVIPVRGGISLDLTRLDRIVAIAPANLTATVQAGVTRLALQRAAGQHGLFFPVDPGADATLGGMAATNAAGTTTVRYGKMRANVLALEAVLPSGQVIRTGSRAAKTSAGYDLTGLLVGSEGTLAVITEVTVRLHAIPEHVVALRIPFPDVESACRTAAAVVAAGGGVSRIELLDAWCMAAVNAYSGTAYPEGPTLLVEAAGSAELGRRRPRARPGDRRRGGGDATSSTSATPTRARACGRRGTTWRTRSPPGSRGRRSGRRTSACPSPSSRAPSASRARRSSGSGSTPASSGTPATATSTSRCNSRPRAVAAAEELVHNVVDDALARGGTCTGEHGVGLGKIGALEREHGDLIPLMQAIKASFDPNGIMNPGKVLPSTPGRRTRDRRVAPTRFQLGGARLSSPALSARAAPSRIAATATASPASPQRDDDRDRAEVVRERLAVEVRGLDEVDQVRQRQDVGDRLEELGVVVRRAERAREERHRQDDEVDDRRGALRRADQRGEARRRGPANAAAPSSSTGTSAAQLSGPSRVVERHAERAR